MAIANSDGSITLSTKVDTSGVAAGLTSIKTAATKISSKIGKSFLALSAAATGAIAVITKQAVDAYADYEQLVGGVETLFKGAAQKMVDYANDAFYTAGMSANDYMENVTAFSASLISSCAGDTDKAADIANQAIIDISDNVNKMGSSMESVTMAFQGFAKQQYMLLDNLKLGYGGTKTEMERLLKDAQAITGVKYNIDNLADVYNAIHVIQEQLGITGTTAEEAEKTITGSANMTKAAWQNVLAAISGGGDLDRAINNLVYSITKYMDNIVPVIQRALVGIGQLIERIAPMLVQNVASALIQAIPSLVNAVYKMIIGLAKGIWNGIKALFTGGTSGASTLTAQLNTVSSSAGNIADNIDDAVDNQNDLTDAVKGTNKEIKKTLAGFDDLQILQEKTSDSSSSGSGSGVSVEVETTIAGAEGNTEDGLLNKKIQEIQTTLSALTIAIGGALAAVGLILLAFGNIPWGIGFLIAGAALFGVSVAVLTNGVDTQTILTNLSNLERGIGVALCAVGLILLFTGQIFWGIGFIIAGAALYGISQGEQTGTRIDETTKNRIQQIEDIVGDVLIAIGLILLFCGQIGFALGFIVVGANVHNISEKEEGSTDVDITTRQKISDIMEMVGKSLIALGLIMIFLGQITWGLGYIVTGAGLFSVAEIIPSMSPSEVLENCDAIISFLSALTAYLITKKLLTSWTKFVDCWGNFKALCQLIAEEGFFKTITTLFGKSLESVQLWAIAIGVITGAIVYLAQNWGELESWQRAITIFNGLAAAITAAAIAIALFHTAWSVGVAAAAIAAGIAILASTYLFKKSNVDTSTITNTSGEAPSDISQYSYLAAGANGVTYKLPALAKGGIVPHATTALIGENGKEAVLPLENNTEWMDLLADRIAAKNSLSPNQQPTREEHYYLNNQQVMSVMYKIMNKADRKYGKSFGR